MASSILCQDIVGICLVLAKGDITMDFEEVILEAEEFQKRNYRAFGQEPTCLRGLFFAGLSSFSHPLEQRLEDSFRRGTNKFTDIRLGDVIPVVLPFFDAHFCDEGDYWTRPGELLGRSSMATSAEYESSHAERWYGYNWEEYQRKLRMKQEMGRLFLQLNPPRAEMVREFMKGHGIDDNLLYRCSRPWRLR